ncbi:MAG: FtsX-like permease family protein [Brevefilum sp.]|jgi:putative ABC transport system permease protein
MFFNLAWRNAKRNRSENLIYFLTLVTAVASFYIMLSLGNQDVMRFLGEIESDAVNRLLTTLMPAVYLSSLVFLFFLVVFANKYQLEFRSRELGLYLIFGMKKKRLFLQLMAEGLITSFLALCGGIICGGFLSEIISLTTARLIGNDVIAHQPSFSLSAVVWAVLGFLLFQTVALFILGGRLFQREIHQLLYGETAKKQNVGNVRGGSFTLVVGALALSIAYWLVLKHFIVAGGAALLVAVILGIAGTLLFIRGLARLLSLLASSIKSKATHGLYTFTLRQLQENIVHRFVSVGMASILMMLTIMLIADGSVSLMSYSNLLIRGASVYDFTITGEYQAVEQYLRSEQVKRYVSDINRMETGKMRRPSGDDIWGSLMDWTNLREQIVQQLPSGMKDPAAQGALNYDINASNPVALNFLAVMDTDKIAPSLLPLSAYNRLLETAGEKPLILKVNEAGFYVNPDFFGSEGADAIAIMMENILAETQTENNALISIEGRPIYLAESIPMKGLTADVNIRIFSALIVSDEMFDQYVDSDTRTVYWNFCIPKELVKKDGLLRTIMDANNLLKPSGLVYESYLDNFGRQLFYVVSGSYSTLYLGFMSLIIACALLALQFLTQMQTTKKRYLTLSMLGAGRKQMKKSMHRQVLWYFLLPLLLACVSGTVGLYFMQVHLHSPTASMERVYPSMIVMAVIVILVLAVYAIAVARTADREISKLTWKPNS